MEEITFKINAYGEDVTLVPRLELYTVHDDIMNKELYGLAIVLDSVNDDYNEQYTVLTVSFGEHIGLINTTYIDTNNCPFADQIYNQLHEKELCDDTRFTKNSGFCSYPLWRFSDEFLKSIGEENYNKYLSKREEYDKDFEALFYAE